MNFGVSPQTVLGENPKWQFLYQLHTYKVVALGSRLLKIGPG